MPTTSERRPSLYLFDLFSVEQLTALTPYSAAYLRDLKARPNRIRPHFRRMVSRLLGKPEDELFGGKPSIAGNRQAVDELSSTDANCPAAGEASASAAICEDLGASA